MIATSVEICDCGSWFEHWARRSPIKATVCGVIGCTNEDLVGAHVVKIDGGADVYVYPICSGCSRLSRDLEAWEGYPLVPANVCK